MKDQITKYQNRVEDLESQNENLENHLEIVRKEQTKLKKMNYEYEAKIIKI